MIINELVDEIFDSPIRLRRKPAKLDKYSPDQARDHLGRWVTSLTGRAADEAVRLTRDKGGFTFTMGRGKLAFPRTGYALSLWPEHTLVLDAQALAGQGRSAARRKLVSWIKANKELLAKPGMHVGGWHNTKTGKAYIDISVVYPKGQLERALSHARKANQIAIWSLHDSDEIAVGGTGEALHKGVPSNSWPPSTASSSPPRGSPTTTRMRKTWPTPSSTPWGLTTTRSHQHLAELIDKYDQDQPRDAQGRWTVVGAGGYPKVDPDARTSGPWADMPHEERRAWDNVFRAWDDITRDDPHQDEPERVFPERYVDRREHFPNGVAGMVLRHGQVESRIRRSTDGGAELYDVSPLAPGLTFDDIPKGAKVDMSGGEGGRPLVEVAGSARPPSFAYRLVAAEEWDQALARGYFQSDGRMNLGASEGTVMSSISTGSFYMPKSGQARIIRFHHDPAWKLDPNDSYIKTQSRIPLDRVDRVTGLIETQYLSKAAHHLGELLYKYNKNHDRVGRFASASGSGGSSEQPPGDWGSHPREWAKHTYEMQGDGWTTRVESDLVAAIVRGHFYSSDHKVMGSFERVIDAKSRTVTHEILVIKPEHQGKGIAEAFNAHAEEAYRAAGIDTIKLTANITVGGYAWAKAGYDWDRDGEDGARYDLEKLISVYQRSNGNTRALVEEDGHPIAPNFAKAESHDAIRMAVRAVARDHHAELVTPEVAAKAEELARIPGRLRPQDVARLGYDQGAVVRGADGRRYWLGKLLLMGSYWEGTKELRSLAMAKYNKNHDARGRFARSSGGTATLERSTAPEGSWGSHPQEWAKHTFEMVGDGWHVTVDGQGSRASERQDGRISVFGKIWSTGTNQVIGEFHRLINPESNSVTHDLLVIEPERQGIGIAKAFNDHAEAAYIEAALERINLHANISIGGYAWAKAGYNWKPNAYEAQTARRNLLALTSNRYRNTDIVAPYIEALGRSEWRIVHQLVEDHYHELVTPEVKAAARQLVQSGPISAQDVARLGHDQGAIVKASNGQRYWAGKLMMLGSDWHGHKKLSPKVAKFNRNHDERGRFARASSSGATATLERPTTSTIGTPPEGNWDTNPHEWTKHTYEAKGDDWSTEASYAGNGMVYGSIFDTWGAQIGKFERRITGDVVDHHLLVIKSDFQGQGIAEAFNTHVEAAYRQAGIKEITLFANINVGGYAWAKAGYNWDKPGSNATLYDLIQLDDQYKSYGGHTHAATSQMCPMLSELRDDKPAIEKMLEDHHAELLTPAVAARVAQLVKPPEGSGGPLSALSAVVPFSAQEVAKLGHDEGAIVTAENGQRYWLGKLLLLGSQWHGTKKLQASAVAKYNKHHDQVGRFASESGAGAATDPPEGTWQSNPEGWAKRAYEMHTDQFSTRIDKVKAYPSDLKVARMAGVVMVRGTVLDAQGKKLGDFNRQIQPDGTADHVWLMLQGTAQGHGIAKAFNAQAEAAYRESGVKQITLHANVSIGGYAWAKSGYNWDGDGEAQARHYLSDLAEQYDTYVVKPAPSWRMTPLFLCPNAAAVGDSYGAVNQMNERHAELMTPVVAAKLKELLAKPEGELRATDVARLGHDEGAIVKGENGQRYWVGKLLLLGSDWQGSKRLQSPAMAKYDPSQPRDRRGRWSASGGRWGAAGTLGSVAAPTDVGHDPQDDALLQTRRKMQAFATKMKPSKDWEERKAAIAELKQPKWYTDPDVVGRIGGRILQEAQDRTKWTLMAHSNFRKQIAQLHGEIANQSAKLPEQMITSPKGVADLKADIAKRQHRLKDLQDKSQRIDQLRFGDHVRAILAELHPMGGQLKVEATDMPPGGDHTWAPARVVHAIESMVPSSWVEWANTSHQYPTSVTMTDRGGMAGAFATRNNHIMVSQHLSPAMQESTALHEFGHLMQLHPLVAEAETAYVHDRLGPTPRAVGAELTSGEVAYLMENPDKPWGNPYSGRLYEGPRKAMTAYGREKAEYRNTDGRSWNGGKRGILHEVLTTGLQHMLDPHDENYDHDLAKWATGMLMLDIPAGDRRRTEG